MDTSWEELIEKLLKKKQEMLRGLVSSRTTDTKKEHMRMCSSSCKASCWKISKSHLQTRCCRTSGMGGSPPKSASKFRSRELKSVRKWGWSSLATPSTRWLYNRLGSFESHRPLSRSYIMSRGRCAGDQPVRGRHSPMGRWGGGLPCWPLG